jgi:hypothetical protein
MARFWLMLIVRGYCPSFNLGLGVVIVDGWIVSGE